MKYKVARDTHDDELVAVVSDRVTCGRLVGYMVRPLHGSASTYFQMTANLEFDDKLEAAILPSRPRLATVNGVPA